MTSTHKILLSIFAGHIVLIIFFGAFKFEKITLFLYSGTWVGIALAMFMFPRTSFGQKAQIIGAVFGVQIVAFVVMDYFVHLSDLMLEEIGFLSIGVWTGILIGNLVRLIEKLEQRLIALRQEMIQPEREGDG